MAQIREWLDRVYLGVDRRLGGRLTLLVHTGLAFGQDDIARGAGRGGRSSPAHQASG